MIDESVSPSCPAVEIHRLDVALGGRSLLRAINLSVAPGEVVGLLGPNGAGKSTLLRCIAGDLASYRGEIKLFGTSLRRWPAREIAKRRAVMPQHQTVPFPFSSEQVVAMGRYPHGDGASDKSRQLIADAMTAAAATAFGKAAYPTLSGGEAQRVQLARSFAQIMPPSPAVDDSGGAPKMMAARLLLVDEPTSSLDPQHQHHSLASVRQLAKRGVACICVLHDLDLAARYCDRVALLHDGHLRAVGTVDDVLTAPLIQSVFDIDVAIVRHPQRRGPVIITLAQAGDHS